jgi:hypothetical protein
MYMTQNRDAAVFYDWDIFQSGKYLKKHSKTFLGMKLVVRLTSEQQQHQRQCGMCKYKECFRNVSYSIWTRDKPLNLVVSG